MTLNDQHKRLLDHLKTGVILLDGSLNLLYINMAAEDLLEMSDRKASQSVLSEVFIGASKDVQEISAAIASSASFTKHRAELRLFNGKHISVDYTVNAYDSDGESQALLELHSLSYSSRISREESLSSSHATTRELVRGLAHEIKNPLGGIRGAAQLLAQELPTPDLQDYTNVIIEEADRLHNLVDRLVGSRKPPNFAAVNIHEVLERVKSLVEAEINSDQIELIRDYDPSIPHVRGDSAQLVQALLNIVRNAMQALSSPSVDHGLGKIILRTRITRNIAVGSDFYPLAAVVEVIDNGPGIPEALINTIFYPMISGRAEGTGLGLSITHSIITLHKGLIECDSVKDKTRFILTLPLFSDVER